VNRPAAEKQVGVARAKRRRLSRVELRAARTHARAVLALAGWASGTCRLTPLSVSDLTQTYRVRAAGVSSILKMLPPSMAVSALQAQALLSARGIALPAVLWSDADRGAILYEDLGSAGLATAPNPDELERVVAYLARLHAAGVVEPAAAAEIVPAIAAHGWPTPAELAGRLLMQLRAETPAARRSLLDIAVTLAAWIGDRPRIVVGDVKREHFRFRGGMPVLTDFELVTAWDVIPSNLATLLAFPGQFQPPIDEPLRRRLLQRYADEHDRLEHTTTDVERLDCAVRCAETLIGISVAAVADLDPCAAPSSDAGAARPPWMIRDRGLFTAASGLLSIEHELGPDLFDLLRSRLNVPHSLRILDLGCGDGKALAQIAYHWPQHRVVGLDRTIGSWRSRRVLGDAQALPVRSGSIDLLYGVQVLQYLPDKVACLADVHRVLAPGGLALFAMTEHFDGASAFVPPLVDMARSWSPGGVVRALAERRLGSRRVLTFALGRGLTDLVAVQRLVGVQEHSPGTVDPHPYLQSLYAQPAGDMARHS
jgi:SAM-dependent methyltransferase